MASIKRSIITHESLSKKILADDGTQYMACCCDEPTPTPTPTPTPIPSCCIPSCCGDRSIDVTFSGITDCGLGPPDCTDFNGNTYTIPYDSYQAGSHCLWKYSSGQIAIFVAWYITSCTMVVNATIRATIWPSRIYRCFRGEDTVYSLPASINNDIANGDCGDMLYSAYQEGYNGEVSVDWA